MCRLAGYVGAPAPLSTLLYDPPRSLEAQAVDPREQLSGTVNVDGTGVAWWGDGDVEPLRYATDHPPWSDPNLASLAPRLQGRVQLAAVRGATPGIGFGPGFVAPFVHGHLAGAHNGWVGQFRTRLAGPLLDLLPDDVRGGLEAVSDSWLLFLLAVARHRDGAGLATAVAEAVCDTAAVCRTHGAPATLTLAVADGEQVVVARAAEATPSNSLYALERPGGGLVASEPLDGGDWVAVPDAHVVVLSAAGVTRSPIPDLEESP